MDLYLTQRGDSSVVRTTDTSISLMLKPGLYSWSVAAVDKHGFTSKPAIRGINVGVFLQDDLYGFQAHAIQETHDGGFVIAGTTDGSTAVSDAILARLDGTGALAWQILLTPADAYPDTAFDVKATSDGGFLVIGSAPEQLYVICVLCSPLKRRRGYNGGCSESPYLNFAGARPSWPLCSFSGGLEARVPIPVNCVRGG